MPIENLYIARVTDGLILVASMEHGSSASQVGDKMELFKSQAKSILKKLHVRSVARMSIESNPYIFHYMIDNGICYLTLTDKSYPKRLAFLFLEEISKEFEADLKAEHGDEWLRVVETVGRQYAFIKFDRVIQKKRRDYSDSSSTNNMKRLNEDLNNIQDIMRKTIDDLIDRDDKLGEITEMSKNLASESKRLKWGAKKLSLMAFYKQWLPLGIILIIALLVLLSRFFSFWPFKLHL